MAIDFGYNDGALFKILGRVAAVIKNQDGNVAAQRTAMASQSSGVVGQLNAEPDVQAIVGGGYLSALSSLGGSLGPLMQQAAAAAACRIVFRDNPRQGQTLQSSDALSCLKEIIRQMKAGGATVLAPAVAAAPSTFIGSGDGVLNASVKRPLDGAALENALAETLNVSCVADSYVGGAAAGSEGLEVTGAGVQGDPFAFDWPAGSGCLASLSCIDGSADATAGNVLTGSGWDSFTANVPDGWEVMSGTAGTDFLKNVGITYDGIASLQLVGDGTTLVRLRQKFGDATGTSGTLNPLAQYSFAGWLRRDGVAAATGTLVASLKDVDGVVLKDAAGNDCTTTIELTALTTDWVAYKASFRTPLVLPDEYYAEVETTAALEAGRSVYLDRFGLGPMTQLYVSGPYLAAHSGAVPFRLADYATVAVTNGRGAAGTLSTWQTVFARLFPDVLSSELLLPSSASPSVLDSWIA